MYFVHFVFFCCFVNLLVVTMQHVGVTSACEVHKYPADIGKYVVSFLTDALVLATVFPCHTLKYFFPGWWCIKHHNYDRKKILTIMLILLLKLILIIIMLILILKLKLIIIMIIIMMMMMMMIMIIMIIMQCNSKNNDNGIQWCKLWCE